MLRTPPEAVHSKDGWDAAEYDSFHEANKLATIESALHSGLHPKADATYDGERDTPQIGQSLLVYSVEVVPAGTDETHELTVVPSSLLDAKDGANTMGELGKAHR
jgi:hypothetical protein